MTDIEAILERVDRQNSKSPALLDGTEVPRLIQALRRRGEQLNEVLHSLHFAGVNQDGARVDLDNEILAILKGEK